jgi:hypothetical protein
VNLRVEDVNKHLAETNKTFEYTNHAIRLVYPENNTKINYATPLRFYIDKRISEKDFLVSYEVDGNVINLTKNRDFYETSPIYYGWRPNADNLTIKVSVQVRHCFWEKCVENTVRDSSYYVFSTEDDPSIGSKEPPESDAELPKPTSVSIIPGFEVLLAIIAITIILIFRRR